MSKISKYFLGAILPILASGCLMTPPTKKSTEVSQSSNHAVAKSPNTSIEGRENQKRRALSKNDRIVSFRVQCEGLFIPAINKIMFQRILPMYGMDVLNNSSHRYDVKYDITISEDRRSMYGYTASTSTEERSFIIRPGSYSELLLTKENLGDGRKVRRIEKIVVLECKKT